MTDRNGTLLRLGILTGALGLAAMFAAAGCDITVNRGQNGDDLPDVAVQHGDTEFWDLRQRPTAAQVGIDPGEDTAIYDDRPARQVVLRLPEETDLRLSARYLAFSAITSNDSAPDGLDVKTPRMPLEDTVESYRSVLEYLDLPTDTVSDFRKAAQAASGTESVHSDRVLERYGDLDLGVLARYSPHSETGVIALGGEWEQ